MELKFDKPRTMLKDHNRSPVSLNNLRVCLSSPLMAVSELFSLPGKKLIEQTGFLKILTTKALFGTDPSHQGFFAVLQIMSIWGDFCRTQFL